MSEIYSFGSTTDLLANIINNYKISIETISKITGIEKSVINNFLNNKQFLDVSQEKKSKFYNLIFSLSSLNSIDENTRIISIIECLEIDYGITIETLSLYSKIDYDKIINFINNKIPFELEEMYKFSIIVLFFHFIFNANKEK